MVADDTVGRPRLKPSQMWKKSGEGLLIFTPRFRNDCQKNN